MSSFLFPLREGQGGPRPTSKAEVGPQAGTSGDQPQAASAWRREMERAQVNTWFKPAQSTARGEVRPEAAAGPAPLNPGRQYPWSPHKAASVGSMMEAAPAVHGAISRLFPGMPAQSLVTAYSSRLEAGHPLVTDLRLAGLALALAGASRLKVTSTKLPVDSAEMVAQAPFAPAAPAAPAPQAGESGSGPQAIRLHAEWQGQDVLVWLGIDAQAEAAETQVAQLLPHIKACLQEQRSRLVKLVCNGRTVFDASDVSSATVSTFSDFIQPKEFP